MGLVWDKKKKKWINDGKAYKPQQATIQSARRTTSATGFVGNSREYAEQRKKAEPIDVFNVKKPQNIAPSVSAPKRKQQSATVKPEKPKQNDFLSLFVQSLFNPMGTAVKTIETYRNTPKKQEAAKSTLHQSRLAETSQAIAKQSDETKKRWEDSAAKNALYDPAANAEIKKYKDDILKPYDDAISGAKKQQGISEQKAHDTDAFIKANAAKYAGGSAESVNAQAINAVRTSKWLSDEEKERKIAELQGRAGTQEAQAALADVKNNTAQVAGLKVDKKRTEQAIDRQTYEDAARLDGEFEQAAKQGSEYKSKLADYFKGSGFERWNAGYLDDNTLAYNMLTPDEVKTYTYYLTKNNGDETVANKYLDSIMPDLQERAASTLDEQVESIDNEAAKKIARAGVTVAGASKNTQRAFMNMPAAFTGSDDVILPGVVQQTQQKTRERLEGAEAFVNDAIYSGVGMAPTIAANMVPGVGQVAGTAMIMATSYSDAYSSAIAQGYEPGDAAAYAIPSAVAEGLTQYALNGVKAFGASSETGKIVSKAAQKAAANPRVQKALVSLGNMGGEALEEYLQANIDPILRNLALGEDNEIDPFSQDKLEAALMGAILAGTMNTTADIAGSVSNVRQNAATDSDYVNAGVINALNNPIVAKANIIEAQIKNVSLTEIQQQKAAQVAQDMAVNPSKYEDIAAQVETNTQPQQNNAVEAITGSESGGSYLSDYAPVEASNLRKEGKTFRNIIAGIDTKISDFFNKWKDGRNSNKGDKLEKLYLGKTTDIANEDISNILGYDVDGRDFIITNDDVRHIMQRHGDDVAEAPNGGVPLNENIMNALPEIIRNPDDIYPGGKGRDGRQSVVFQKTLSDGTAVYIRFDNTGRKTLQGKTLYIKKSPTSMRNAVMPSSFTSETTEPELLSTSNVAQDNEIVNSESVYAPDEIGRGGNKFQRGVRNAYQSLVSAQEPIENVNKLQRKLGVDETADANTQLVRQAGGTADFIITEGLTDRAGNIIGKSFKQLLSDVVGKDSADFNQYMQNLHNVDRWKQNVPVNKNTTVEQSQKIIAQLEQKHPDFKSRATELETWWNDFSQEWAVNSGLRAPEVYNLMREMYPNYIPTHRKGKKGGQSLGKNASTPNLNKKATGGVSEVMPLEHQFVDQINKTVRAARINELNLDLLNFARSEPEAAAEAGIALAPTQNIAEIKSIADIEGIKDIGDTSTFYAEPNSGKYQVTAYENGQPVTMNVSKDMYQSLIRLRSVVDDSAVNGMLRVLRKTSGVLKTGYTGINAVFTLTNAIRDIQTYFVNTKAKNPFKAVSNYGKALAQVVSNGDMYKQYKALGGDRQGFYGQIKRDANGDIVQLPQRFLDKSVGEKVKAVLSAPFEGIAKIGGVLEQGPRLAEYMNTIDAIGDTSIGRKQGVFNSADVTTNFSRSAPITKVADSFTLYLNAAVQGLDKMVRQMKEHPVKTTARAAAFIMLPSLLLALINAGNDHYDELDDRTKDAYYLIPNLGDLDEQGQAKTFIKIPRSREYGALFGAITDRFVRSAETGDLGESFKGYWGTVSNDLLPPLPFTDNFASPFVSGLLYNQDFAGRKVVPDYMKDLEPKYQQDINTSGIAKAIGEQFNISPKQVDYVIKQFGYPGELLQGATSQKNNSAGEALNTALVQPFVRRFTADSRYSSALTDKLYDKVDELNRKVATEKYTGNESEESKEQKRIVTNATSVISDLRKYEKEVQASSLPMSEKEAAIDTIKETINDVARRALQLTGEKGEKAEPTPAKLAVGYSVTTRADGSPESTVLNAMANGIPAADYYENDLSIKKINGTDLNGESVPNLEGLRKKTYIDGLNLTSEQKKYMYEAYSIGNKVKTGLVTWKDMPESLQPQNAGFAGANAPSTSSAENGDTTYSGGASLIIKEAEKYSTGSLRTSTLEKLNTYGINPKDYAYVNDRLAGYDDKVKYLQNSGFKDAQLTGMVAMTVMGDTAKDKMTVAQEDMNIPNDVYVNTYITGYSSVGSKAERNKQIREYVDGLPNLTQEQKDALYNWNKVSRGKSADGKQTSSGGSGGSGRRGRSGGSKSTKASAQRPDLNWSTLKGKIGRSPVTRKTATPNLQFDLLAATETIGREAKQKALNKELEAVDQSPFFTKEMKVNIKRSIRTRYES